MSTTGISTEAFPRPVTAEELLRDYRHKRCDLVEARVREMPPAGFGHGTIAQRIGAALANYVSSTGMGIVTAAETGFRVATSPDTVLAPDPAFIRQERVDAIGVTEGYFPEAPALAVEVTSPDDSADDVEDKVRRWLAAGCETVWVVYSRGKSVAVYRSLDDVKVLTGDAVLDGDDVVPGFSHPVAELFPG